MKVAKKYAGLFALAVLIPMQSQANPVCVSEASDPDGDGWGWENEQTCVVSSAPCIDPDGDGWGWDGTQSCRIEVIQCLDPDGDGWGWNGQETCLVSGGPVEPAACEDTPPLNDTWGWNGVASCRIPPEIPATDTSAIAGLWDGSDEDDSLYLHIESNGYYSIYYSDEETGDCFEFEDPNAEPEVTGAKIISLDGNQYEFYYYEIFNGEIFEEREPYQMFVSDNTLNIVYEDIYYDENDQLITEVVTDLLPALDMSIADIALCSDQ